MNIAVLDDMPEDLNRLCRLLESVCAEHTPRPMIHYVDADGRRCSFHLTDGTTLSPYMTLARARELLDAMPMFLSCHRSLLVNMDEIHQLTPEGILLSDGTLLPIATRRKSEVERIYRAYMLKEMRTGFLS